MDDLLKEFVGETLDMMDAVAGDLVAWEADPADRSGLDGIFRTVHTVKGSSSFFDLPRITAIAHATEELLDVLRSRKGAPTRASVAVVLVAFDKIREIAVHLSASGGEPLGDDSRLIAALLADVRSADRQSVVSASGEAQLGHAKGSAPALEELPQAWRTVRVPLALLDELMIGVSDLVLSRNEVAAQLRARGEDMEAFAAFGRMSQLLGSVRAMVSTMRMVPLRHLYAPLPRLVRQLAGELDKQVQLSLEGGDVEIDRELVEVLRDPIIHMLRNAVDHGVEGETHRQYAGKPAAGHIRVCARQAGNRILISISDDGKGLPIEAIVASAIRAGHVTPDDVAAMDEAGKADLVFLPGLSTAATISGISGRGVGMDVVRANIERLGGVIRIDSRSGHGVTLTLDVPMTLTVISALAVDAGNQSFAIPRSAIDEVMLLSSDAVQQHDQPATAGLVRVRERMLPMLRLESILGVGDDGADEEGDRALIICRHGNAAAFALDVPDVRDHEELVIKPLPPVLLSIGMYSGLSLPDSGKPMLVLDIDEIARRHIGTVPASIKPDRKDAVVPAEKRGRSWLTYRAETGGPWRAVPMDHVERLYDVPANHVHASGGGLVAQVDDRLIAVAGDRLPEAALAHYRMIRLNDGCRVAMLPVWQIGDTVELKAELPPADLNAGLSGLTLMDGDLVELVDSYVLLARYGNLPGRRDVPCSPDRPEPVEHNRELWIVDPAGSEWTTSFLVPTLVAAGYRLAIVTERNQVTTERSPVILLSPKGPADPLTLETGEAVHHLSAYDREGLLSIIGGGPAPSAPIPVVRDEGAAA
ncbi:chemotaxis protein CheA [Sphingomonas lacunae]|uniref:Chemotaxis protein CheA n=1 Tax=Sphingomonas lacunae TaxID=2698828 RepID=A0A6M4AV46_9SPHN|nr:chemotaxis protein CheW [Sphingomonas lacunae]QJQ32973.1 chemotaxis protein CheA [Sphingomonas lacunae]